jgi:hypothetical protein
MMDWHYHKDDIPTKEEIDWEEDVRRWQAAGFSIIYMSQKDALVCPHCGSLVKEDQWKKHLKSLHE